MNYINKVVLLAACLLLMSTTTIALPIAVVNGESIDKKEEDTLVAGLVKNGQKDTAALREQVRLLLIDQVLVRQECLRQKFDKRPMFKDRLKAAQSEILQDMFVEEVLKIKPISESAIKTTYDNLKKEISASRDLHVRQIIVKTEKEAKEIIALLKKRKNTDFVELAKSRSIDSRAKQNGGSLGVLNSKLLEAKFPHLFRILGTLDRGTVVEQPIESDSGWHIFKIDDVSSARVPSYEEAKPQILRSLQRRAVEKAIDALRSKATIK
ncbi:MAG: peptidyl-prolyl cis-trans isomerase [Neisseriales bacterium]|nr:MAG: peptidyl-prolyl cis-trans isomerase [Neisseriales bacterium]